MNPKSQKKIAISTVFRRESYVKKPNQRYHILKEELFHQVMLRTLHQVSIVRKGALKKLILLIWCTFSFKTFGAWICKTLRIVPGQ